MIIVISIAKLDPFGQFFDIACHRRKKSTIAQARYARSLEMEKTTTIRVAPALAVVAVLRDFDLDPAAILTEAGWSPNLLNDPENIVPYAAMGRLIAIAATRTNCDHFGLLFGLKAGSSVIGALGFASRHAQDVRSALRLLTGQFAHHDRGGVATFVDEGTVAALGYRILDAKTPGSVHITAGSLAIAFHLLKTLCGPYWRPLETSFAFRRPADAKPYHNLFGTRVCFDAEQSSVSFSSHWLDCKVIGADPELQRVLLRGIGRNNIENPTNRDLRSEIRGVLTGMMGREDVRLAAVAKIFNLSSRTLHRRLATLGTSFQEIVDEVRCEMACQLLKNTTLPISQLSVMLGFSEVSAFSRSFKRRLACGPGAWRASNGAMEAERDRPIHSFSMK